jgi:hypothetical protein
MNEPLWTFLLKLLFPPLSAAFLASYITYWLSHRRFIQERWWDRKADAYAKIIENLVALTYSLERWARYEWTELAGEEVLSPRAKEDYEAVPLEYEEVKARIERAATQGGYIISEKAANALSELIRQLRKAPEQSGFDVMSDWCNWINSLHDYSKAAHDCLQAMRDEARSDLRVK